jgi:hypothetical protein
MVVLQDDMIARADERQHGGRDRAHPGSGQQRSLRTFERRDDCFGARVRRVAVPRIEARMVRRLRHVAERVGIVRGERGGRVNRRRDVRLALELVIGVKDIGFGVVVHRIPVL